MDLNTHVEHDPLHCVVWGLQRVGQVTKIDDDLLSSHIIGIYSQGLHLGKNGVHFGSVILSAKGKTT